MASWGFRNKTGPVEQSTVLQLGASGTASQVGDSRGECNDAEDVLGKRWGPVPPAAFRRCCRLVLSPEVAREEDSSAKEQYADRTWHRELPIGTSFRL